MILFNLHIYLNKSTMRIAITGKMCSGKTYIADYLIEKYNLTKFSFASEVKNIASELFNMENKDRKLLQTVADKMKDIDKDVWVKYTLKLIGEKQNVVIDDLRFKNELKYLRENGFITIRINISNEEQESRLSKKYPDTYNEHLSRRNHNSEIDIENLEVDYEFNSDENLINNINKLLNDLKS